jgi:hypothetical protein
MNAQLKSQDFLEQVLPEEMVVHVLSDTVYVRCLADHERDRNLVETYSELSVVQEDYKKRPSCEEQKKLREKESELRAEIAYLTRECEEHFNLTREAIMRELSQHQVVIPHGHIPLIKQGGQVVIGREISTDDIAASIVSEMLFVGAVVQSKRALDN